MEAWPDVFEVLLGDEAVGEVAVAVAQRGRPPAIGLEAGSPELRVVRAAIVEADPSHQASPQRSSRSATASAFAPARPARNLPMQSSHRVASALSGPQTMNR